MTIEPFVAKRGGILPTGDIARQDLPGGSRQGGDSEIHATAAVERGKVRPTGAVEHGKICALCMI